MNNKDISNHIECSVLRNKAFMLLSSPWKVFILAEINTGMYRFGELKRYFCEISRVTLSKYLFELERDGLIIRKEYPAPPLKVEYILSEEGLTVLPIIEKLIDWGGVSTSSE